MGELGFLILAGFPELENLYEMGCLIKYKKRFQKQITVIFNYTFV